MLLELATTVGALTGAFVAILDAQLLFILFGAILLFSLLPTLKKLGEDLPAGVHDDALARRLRLASTYPNRIRGSVVSYEVTRVPLGSA